LDGKIVVWDPGQKKKLGELSGHTGAIAQFAVRVGVPDLASASADGTIKLWDLKSRIVVRTLTGHGGAVLSLAMSRDEKVLASGSADTTVKLWNVESGAELRTLPHPSAVRALEFDAAASTVACGGDDGTIALWDLKAGWLLRTMRGSKGQILNLFFSGDRRWLVAYQSTAISIWDTSTGVAAVEDYTIEAALSRPDWPFRAVMQDVSRRALHQ
jgi:WD40 repeat protein